MGRDALLADGHADGCVGVLGAVSSCSCTCPVDPPSFVIVHGAVAAIGAKSIIIPMIAHCLFGCGSDNLGVETVLQVRLEDASDCQPTSCHLILEGPAQRPWGLHLEAKDPEKSRPEQWMVCGGVAE